MTGSRPDPLDDQVASGPPGLPRWVKLLALGLLMMGAALVGVMLLVGGEHGPGMHGG
jgi:hypothetical protein